MVRLFGYLQCQIIFHTNQLSKKVIDFNLFTPKELSKIQMFKINKYNFFMGIQEKKTKMHHGNV